MSIITDIRYISMNESCDNTSILTDKNIKRKGKRYRAAPLESIFKKRRTDSGNQLSEINLQVITLYISHSMRQELQVLKTVEKSQKFSLYFSGIHSIRAQRLFYSLLYSIYLLAKFSHMSSLNIYLFQKDHQHAVRICNWGKYVVVMDLLENYTVPGKYGFQIEKTELYRDTQVALFSEKRIEKLLPITTQMTEKEEDWQWGINALNPSNMTKPKFLIEYSLSTWCDKVF
jgi:hypothetical protein